MSRPIPDLRACKTEAKRLLAALNSNDRAVARTAAQRFRVPPFEDMSDDQLVAARDTVQLKHAQAVVARERKFPDWKSLKDAADVVWYPRNGDAFLNAWFAHYDQARAHLDAKGGFLLTHRGDYFVCGEGFIRARGLDPADPRWDAIGHDVARPRNRRACDELRALAEAAAKTQTDAVTTATRSVRPLQRPTA